MAHSDKGSCELAWAFTKAGMCTREGLDLKVGKLPGFVALLTQLVRPSPPHPLFSHLLAEKEKNKRLSLLSFNPLDQQCLTYGMCATADM